MRIVVAPDSFGGTLTAREAAEAIAAGWRQVRPADELELLPLSDGGPGFLDVMPGTRHEVTVEDPMAQPVTAAFQLAGTTGYVEAAQAAGLHLVRQPDPTVTTTYGVGQLIRAAVECGATTVVVGLGGTATNDGGSGMLAALGVRREDVDRVRLPPGGLALTQAARLVGAPLKITLVAATDVDNPLLGPTGATAVYAPQKGAGPDQIAALEVALTHWADLLEQHLGRRARELPGAGAGGGLGFAVLAAGGTRRSGIELVSEVVGLQAAVRTADLVLTGEGSFDGQSLRGKVVAGVAAVARQAAVPCVVLAGRVAVGRQEQASAGIDAAYALVEGVGAERALAEPAETLATLAAEVARDWGV